MSLYLNTGGAFTKLNVSHRAGRIEAKLRELLACRVGDELILTRAEIEAAERVLDADESGEHQGDHGR